MDIIYDNNDIRISNKDTLILGADNHLKKDIKNKLSKTCSIVDSSFSYTTNTVGETIENSNFSISYITDFKSKNIEELIFDEYYFLAILIKLFKNPKTLLIDNLFGYLNNSQKEQIILLAKEKHISLIIFDNELYYAYYNYEVIVIHDNKLAIKGAYKEVVKQELILKRLGYELPFYVDLSIQLKLYGLIDNICYSYDELEEALWK